MAIPVYSLRIFSQGILDIEKHVIVPDPYIYIVRDIDVTERAGSTSSSFFFEGDEGQIIWAAYASVSGIFKSAQWRGRQIFYPGEPIGFNASVGSWDVTCSGYQLTPP
jgi:hypothetical protein